MTRSLHVLLILTLAALPTMAQDRCAEVEAEASRGNDLYCLDLVPRAEVPGATGRATLGRVPSPFGVAVTPDGHHRFDLTLTLAGLPDPATLGPYTAYVAWATTPVLHPMVKLGAVANGRWHVGEVAMGKFMIFVTAEADAEVTERAGKLVMRGRSASMRMEPHDAYQLAPVALLAPDDDADEHAHHHGMTEDGWAMPPMHPNVPMMPGMRGLTPKVAPFRHPLDPATLPEAQPRRLVRLADGDTLMLDAAPVARTIRGKRLALFGFNGQIPGPLLHVPEAATVTIRVTNHTGRETALHWHGLRLDNRFDGVPGLTQDPIPDGGTFDYTVHFPDAGIYWYHPHHREDVFQELGLYGNILVRPDAPDYFGPAHREEVLMLDDLLLDADGVVPFGEESANYMLMGRFGNVFLVNGEPDYALDVRRGEVVRFFLTNVSNTRTFNLSFGGRPLKVVAADIGRYEREVWAESVVIAPAERYVVEVLFEDAGPLALTNRVQALDHRSGFFFPEVDTLGLIAVAEDLVAEPLAAAFDHLRRNDAVVADIDRYRPHFARPPDHELLLTLEVEDLPAVIEQLMRLDYVYFNPVEWSGTMPMMNWMTSGEEIAWTLRDAATGKENLAIDWRFRVGDVVKIRLINDRDGFHAMQHPFHIHGQRFLVLQQDGVPTDNLVWKDTVLLPVGSTTDILLDLTNPGQWMAHCHIAEHLASGMRMVFSVE